MWVLAIKAVEYGCLGLALEWVSRRAWGSAVGHLAVGLLTGVVFGGLFLRVVVQSAPTPLPTPSLVARGLNELLFPVGCALVVFIAEILRTHLDPAAADRPLTVSVGAEADQPTPDPLPGGVDSRPGTLTEAPLCGLDRGHWACLSHRRTFRTRRGLDRHLRLGEHRLVWLCWATAPNSQALDSSVTSVATGQPASAAGQAQSAGPSPIGIAVSQRRAATGTLPGPRNGL